MSDKPFLDTNVLIYAFADGDPRRDMAKRLLAEGGVVSVQVLNEFASVCRRKLALDWEEIDHRISLLRVLLDEPLPLTAATHDEARRLAKDAALAFYDALIVASATEAKSPIIYSEDMQDGQRHGAVTVTNPFRR
jgi:predicted nucleic acid-binding protein